MGKILCACMLMIFVNMSSRTVFAQSHYMEIDSLLIHYVDFNLMTMIDIGCDNFESALAYKTVVLRDSSCIAELADILLEEKCKTEQPIDVRCKIYMFTPQGVKVMCLGKDVLCYNSNSYKINSLFIDRVKKLILKGEKPLNDTIITHTPILLVKQDDFYNSIRQRCLPIMKKEKIDSLKIIVDFCINRKGHAVDVFIKGWKNQFVPDSLQHEITRLFQERLKWSASENRSHKVRKVLPLVLVSD